MELKEPPDPIRVDLIPVVQYAVERKIATGKPDYWDHASRMEQAVLANDEEKAMAALGHSLASVRDPWEPETTLRNLRLIDEERKRRGEKTAWMHEIEEELKSKTKQAQ